MTTFCYPFKNSEISFFSKGPILMEITKQLAKTFSGNSCLLINDTLPDRSLSDLQDVRNKFFIDEFKEVKKSTRIDKYKKKVIHLIKNGYAHIDQKNLQSPELQAKIFQDNENIPAYFKPMQVDFEMKIDDILHGQIYYSIPKEQNKIIFYSNSNFISTSFSNVIDYQDFDINYVIRDYKQIEQSAEEILFCYFLGVIPPYFMHFNFDDNFPKNTYHMFKEKNVFESAVQEAVIDRKKSVDTKFKFLKKKIENIFNINKNSNYTIDSIQKIEPSLKYETAKEIYELIEQVKSTDDIKRRIVLSIIKFTHHQKIQSDFYSDIQLSRLKSFLQRILISYNLDYDKNSIHQIKKNFLAQTNMPELTLNHLMSYCLLGEWGINNYVEWEKIVKIIGKRETESRMTKGIKELERKNNIL